MRHALLLAATLVVACRAPMDEVEEASFDAQESALIEGSPDAVGVLAFLNASTTTMSVLDAGVGLDKRAAQNLIAHRDGKDAAFGTSDDDRFGDIVEVDSVPWVGPATIAKLVAFASSNGWVPQGDDVLGTYDGVTFTVDEAMATLVLSNSASDAELDDEVDLDHRAVVSIVGARPIESMPELAGLYYVAASALTKLKAHALTDDGGSDDSNDASNDCTSDTDCEAPNRCYGYPNDGSPLIGKCVNTAAHIPGNGAVCDADTTCNAGLACMGTTVYDGSGYCRPEWMQGTFVSHEVKVIPDANTTGVSSSVLVHGLATAPDDIVVTLDIDHPRLSDLVVRLVSSHGQVAELWNHEGSPVFQLPALCCIERDTYVNGTWSLEVVDTVGGQVGHLNGFELFITSRFD